MKNLLAELLAEVRPIKPAAAATLRRGLPRKAIRACLAELPYRITPDAVSLYEWADGADGPFELLPSGYFMPLSAVIEEFKIVHPLDEELNRAFPERYRECVRFLNDGSDGGYAFGRVDSACKGRIVSLCIHEPWMIGFRTLEDLLRTAIASYRAGIFRPDPEIPDFFAYFRLAARLNPGLKVWRKTQGSS